MKDYPTVRVTDEEMMMSVEVLETNTDNVIATLSVPMYMRHEMVRILTPFRDRLGGKGIHGVCKSTGEIFPLPAKEFKGNRIWDFWNLREVCIQYDLFTNGDCRQYDRFFDMVDDGATFDELMLVVWICSNKETFVEVERIFLNEFLPR